MKWRRFVAVSIVVGSACGVFEEQLVSTTGQDVAVVNMFNPFTYTTPLQTQQFTVVAQNFSDSDDIVSISPANASACVNFHFTQAMTFPQHICGGGGTFAPQPPFACPRNYSFMIQYVGNSSESCTMNIGWVSTNGGGSGSGSGVSTLQLNSMISASGFTVSPAMLNFGQLGSGTMSSSQSVTVTNTGSASIQISGVLSGPGAAAFAVMPVGSATLALHTLAGSGTDGFKVTCTPPDVAIYTAMLTFTGGPGPMMHGTMLNCEGISSQLVFQPSQVTFPSTLVGRPPMDQTIHITGPPTTMIQSVTLDQTAQDNKVHIIASPTLGALGTGVDIVLHYDAASEHPSGPLGFLLVKTDEAQMPRSVAISGEALLGSIGTNPADGDLGPICGGGSASLQVEVFANAAGTVMLQQPAQPGSPFTYSSQATFPAMLRGNHLGGTMLTISASPTMPGEISSTMSFVTDVPGSDPYPFMLHATVLAAGVAATPAKTNFGTIDINASTSGREIKLTNCGTADLMVTGASIGGKDAKAFLLVAPGDPAMVLKKSEHETFLVIMQSQTATGDMSAVLHIEHDGTSTDADLVGTVGGSADRETYYGCAVAGGGSGALLVVAVLLVTRRRRRSR